MSALLPLPCGRLRPAPRRSASFGLALDHAAKDGKLGVSGAQTAVATD